MRLPPTHAADRRTYLDRVVAEQQAYLDRAMALSHPVARQVLAAAEADVVPAEAGPLLVELRRRLDQRETVGDVLAELPAVVPWCFVAAGGGVHAS